MIRVIALLSMPPPNLRPFIVMPAALVFSYTFFSAIGDRLADFGLSPLVLAVVLSMGVTWSWHLPNTVRRIKVDRETWLIAAFFVFAILALLLIVHDPLWCQRVFSVMLSYKAIYLAHALWRAPKKLTLLGGPTDGPNWFAKSWGRWKLVSLLMLILMNETAIAYGTLTEWVIVWSVAPIIAYCLMYWSIEATWEDDPNQE